MDNKSSGSIPCPDVGEHNQAMPIPRERATSAIFGRCEATRAPLGLARAPVPENPLRVVVAGRNPLDAFSAPITGIHGRPGGSRDAILTP